MPLVWNGAHYELKCVNHQAHTAPGQPATMLKSTSWNVVPGVAPPANRAPLPGAWFVPPPAGPSTPVRLYVCSVCGYAEMYAGDVSEPDVWRRQ